MNVSRMSVTEKKEQSHATSIAKGGHNAHCNVTNPAIIAKLGESMFAELKYGREQIDYYGITYYAEKI